MKELMEKIESGDIVKMDDGKRYMAFKRSDFEYIILREVEKAKGSNINYKNITGYYPLKFGFNSRSLKNNMSKICVKKITRSGFRYIGEKMKYCEEVIYEKE